MGKYVVETDAYQQTYVWYYRDDNDSNPLPLLAKDEVVWHTGGPALWASIVKMVENGQVGA
jgi:hypothetical protein